MVKSHVEAPAVYLKNFTCCKGAYKDNSDPLQVYDKMDGTWHYDYHPRDDRFTTLDFFSADIETYNDRSFETKYDRLYKQVVRSFSAGLEIPVNSQKRMTAFVANLRARQITDNLPDTFRNDFEVRNSLIKPATEVFQNGYHNEILYIHDAMGGFITGDSPLLTIGPKSLLLSNAAIRVLPLDFQHLVMLLQWRNDADYTPLRSVFDAWAKDPLKATYFICAEEIIAAKQFIFFKTAEMLKNYLNMEFVKNTLQRK